MLILKCCSNDNEHFGFFISLCILRPIDLNCAEKMLRIYHDDFCWKVKNIYVNTKNTIFIKKACIVCFCYILLYIGILYMFWVRNRMDAHGHKVYYNISNL